MINGSILSSPYEIVERGVFYNTEPLLLGGDCPRAYDSVNSIGVFSVNATGLLGNTKYYIRSYAKNIHGDIGYFPKELFEFGYPYYIETKASAPRLSSPIYTNLGETYVDVFSTIVNTGGPAEVISNVGACWSSTTATPTIENCDGFIAGTLNGLDISASITGLTNNTNYYFRCYAENGVGVGYSGSTVFTTTTLYPPEITVQPVVTKLDSLSAKVIYSASSIGNVAEEVNIGICWSTTNTNPDVTDDKIENIGYYTEGVELTDIITGITDGTYYINSYIETSVGIAYSNPVTYVHTSSLVNNNVTLKVTESNPDKFSLSFDYYSGYQISNFYLTFVDRDGVRYGDIFCLNAMIRTNDEFPIEIDYDTNIHSAYFSDSNGVYIGDFSDNTFNYSLVIDDTVPHLTRLNAIAYDIIPDDLVFTLQTTITEQNYLPLPSEVSVNGRGSC